MTADRPFFTIAVPTFNRAESVNRRVEEFLTLSAPSSVHMLVIDNHSTDGAYELLTSKFSDPRLRVLSNASNLGFAGNFLRLIDEAQGEYMVVVSDEDRLNPDALGELMEFCRLKAPRMVSPRAQVGDNTLYRGRSATREIRPDEFESASFYLSGLTFSVDAAQAVVEVVRSLVPANSAATVYTQVLLTALLVARGDAYFLDAGVSSQSDVHETAITEASGIPYYGVEGRWAQFRSFEEFFAMDHSATVGEQNTQRLETMRDTIREGILDLLVNAATREVPAVAPYLQRPLRRSLGGRLADAWGRFSRQHP